MVDASPDTNSPEGPRHAQPPKEDVAVGAAAPVAPAPSASSASTTPDARRVRHRRSAPSGVPASSAAPSGSGASRRAGGHERAAVGKGGRGSIAADSARAAADAQRPEEQARPGATGRLEALRGKGVRAALGIGGNRPPKPPRKNKSNPIARLVNRWFDRVMGAVKDGGLSNQEEEYAAHKTTRDFVWNSVGVGAWGLVFPALTMVSTQLVGVEEAGMVSMAFVVGTLLMFIANFGVRTYQVSDTREAHSFNDYQINRWITCAAMIVIGIGYCMVRGYGAEMFSISMGVFVYKMIDGLADVYEGRLQQMDKLYLGGISQAIRSIAALVVFAIVLAITRDAAIAGYAMAAAAAVTFVVVTYPLTLLETPRSARASLSSIGVLFKNTAPLFVALFMFNLIENMPKFVMEGMLPYDNQLYFNALYFPAQGILITAQLVYKPLIVRMAGVWQDPSKRRKFDLILVGMMLLVVAITAVNVVVMAWIGIPIMGFLYGIDFEQFRGLLYTMLVAGGVTAAIDFLYQVVTVMRRQKDVTTLYVVTFGFSLFIPLLLVSFTGLPGAILSYLIVMSILFVLLVWEYLRIRRDLSSGRRASAGYGRHVASRDAVEMAPMADYPESDFELAPQDPEPARPRPSEVRAERLRREEVMNRRVTNRRP